MIVPLSQAGKHLTPPLTRQALQAWFREGCDAKTADGLVDVEKLRAWQAKYKTDPREAGHGGKRKGAGRPKGSKNKTAGSESGGSQESDSLAAIRRDQEVLKLSAMRRAEQLAAGELVKADDTEKAVRRVCTEVRASLEQIPARASRRLVDELGLYAGLILRIRGLLTAEVDHACRVLAGLTHDDHRRSPDAGGA